MMPWSIPACTGETFCWYARIRPFRVYPRVYGGNAKGTLPTFLCHGLSPRVRGKLAEDRGDGPGKGSIPACTGETPYRTGHRRRDWVYPRVYGGNGTGPRSPLGQRVYPRVYGGNWPNAGSIICAGGLSPRVRGKPKTEANCLDCGWSIPACTGETQCFVGKRQSRPVYPRVYGGNANRPWPISPWWGLSPRVRGKPLHSQNLWFGGGLSPRVRGKRFDRVCNRRYGGSIPACTGETGCPAIRWWWFPVYPRVYGGNPTLYTIVILCRKEHWHTKDEKVQSKNFPDTMFIQLLICRN